MPSKPSRLRFKFSEKLNKAMNVDNVIRWDRYGVHMGFWGDVVMVLHLRGSVLYILRNLNFSTKSSITISNTLLFIQLL